MVAAVTLPMNAQVYKETDKSVKTRITELYGHARKGVQKAERIYLTSLALRAGKTATSLRSMV
jgi:hypothetical protein